MNFNFLNFLRNIKPLLTPTKLNKDTLTQKKKILNILLLLFSIFSSLMLVVFLFNRYLINNSHLEKINSSIWPIVIFTTFFWILLNLNKNGYFHLSSKLFLTSLFAITWYLAINWGIDNPQVLLMLALIAVSSLLLLGSKHLALCLFFSFLIIIFLGNLQISSKLSILNLWKQHNLTMADLIAYFFTISLIALIAWLAVCELEKALYQAQKSKLALAKERDGLKKQVKIKSQQLIKQHQQRFLENYRFIELGRHAAGFYHDLVNPLTTANLLVKNINRQNTLDLNKQLAYVTARMEQFIKSLNKQIKQQNINQHFFLKSVIDEVIDLLTFKAKQHQIKICKNVDKKIKIFGDPLKLNQVLLNILSNAIDAYKNSAKENKIILIKTLKEKNKIIITVKDFGCGISKKNMSNLFKPFFTTKSPADGTGLGLSKIKRIVEQNFHGIIKIDSQYKIFTKVNVEIPHKINLNYARLKKIRLAAK